MPARSASPALAQDFRCAGCGHDRAYGHKKRLIDEYRGCGKQHSILAWTIFAEKQMGLAKWFPAIDLVTSSKRGSSALSALPTGSARIAPLRDRLEADGTLIGGPGPGKPGRGGAGKTVVVGALEGGRGKAKGRRPRRLRLSALPNASASSLKGPLAANRARPGANATDGGAG